MRSLKPFGAEEPLRKKRVPAIDDERLSTVNNVHQHDLLELLLTKIANLVPRNPLNPFEVGCPIDQAMHIKIRRERIKLRLGMRRRGHVGGIDVDVGGVSPCESGMRNDGEIEASCAFARATTNLPQSKLSMKSRQDFEVNSSLRISIVPPTLASS